MLKEKLQNLSRFRFDDIYDIVAGFDEKQQKILFSVLGVVVLLILFLPNYIFSFWIDSYKEDYNSYSKDVSKFYGKVSEYASLNNQISQIQKQGSNNFNSLKVIIEKIAKDIGISNNIRGLPESKSAAGEFFQEIRVDGRMSQVPLDKFLSFLKNIESYKQASLRVQKINLRADPRNRNMLRSANFMVSLLKPMNQQKKNRVKK